MHDAAGKEMGEKKGGTGEVSAARARAYAREERKVIVPDEFSKLVCPVALIEPAIPGRAKRSGEERAAAPR